MSKQLFANNAISTLSGVLPKAGTTLVCMAGQGSRFPTPTGGDFFLLTIYTKDVYATEQEVEVVKVTGRAEDVLTIERDVELLTGEVGGLAYNGSTTTVFLELRWTAMGASNVLQASDNLGSIASPGAARANLGLSSSDVLAEGATNLYFLASRVREALLTGLSVATNAVISAGDTVLEALGKVQAQITSHFGSGGAAHANATTEAAGFMSAADKTKVNNAATLTGAETLTNKTLTGYTETVYALIGTTPVFNPANGTIQTWTLLGNSTPTSSINAGQSMTLMIDDGTAYTITWPSVTWMNGTAPVLNTSGYTTIVLWKVGSTLYGKY